MRQLLLIDDKRASFVHGGEHALGKRKSARFVSSRKPMHLVLRVEERVAQNKSLSFRRTKNFNLIQTLLHNLSRRFGIRVYESGIVGNHLHLLIRAQSKIEFQNFLRTLSGQIAQKITGAIKGRPFGKFWESLAFSRVIEWGKGYFTVKRYVIQNELEAGGQVPYQPRKRSLGNSVGRPRGTRQSARPARQIRNVER